VMNDVEDVWWCRTPKNSVVYGSGERRIRGQRRIALHSGARKLCIVVQVAHISWEQQSWTMCRSNSLLEYITSIGLNLVRYSNQSL
jgi:hypothetical protein